ncbi:MAG: hypothetical protein KME64_16980 [Scytonematopsis contorta HA4267-MV1]|jgi:hypothetical protein|nr:hypothetical protein [Scytonematopsis contorta HA4267-MV1]
MTPSTSTNFFTQTISTPKWEAATWSEYLSYTKSSNPDITGLFFNQGYLLVEMGNEGIDHAAVNELFTRNFISV